MRRKLCILLILLVVFVLLSACTDSTGADTSDNKINIVTTTFVPFDIARAIGGDYVDIEMLLDPGMEIHSYDPTPKDIISIYNADLFIYFGGESEEWVEDIIDELTDSVRILRLMDCVNTILEEVGEDEEGEEETEYDEHIWTSISNMKDMTSVIYSTLCELDSKCAGTFKINQDKYLENLTYIDNQYKEIVSEGIRNEIIFADRFPFIYFVSEYGLDYYSAFSGCAENTEPSAAIVSDLIDKVEGDNIPAVFYTEFSNQKLADIVCEETGAGKLMFHSCHNITRDEMDKGVTYYDLQLKNIENLRKALN